MRQILWLLVLWPALAFGQPAPPTPGPGPVPGVPANGALALQNVYPENYGALGNGVKTFDGAVTSNPTTATANNSGTAFNSPAVTTANNNDFVLSIFSNGVAYATPPSFTNSRTNTAFGASSYGLQIGDQLVATAGSVAAITSTLNSATQSTAATLALVPNGSISFIAATTAAAPTSSPPISLTKPTGTATGDFQIACFTFFGGASVHPVKVVPTNSSGWSMILSGSFAGNPNLMCLGRVVTASEPASYTFKYAAYLSTTGQAALLDYRNVAGVENMGQTLTSATANFPSSAVGYPVCVAGEFGYNAKVNTNSAYAYPQQVCGTITAVNSPTSINTSFYLPYSQTGLPIAYGHDDTTAINTMFSSAGCQTAPGCSVKFGQKHYITTGLITIPQGAAINVSGTVPQVSNTINNYINQVPLANATGGSSLTMLAQGANSAAVQVGAAASTNVGTTASTSITNLAIIGGVGNYADGGGYASTTTGTDGLDLLGVQNFECKHCIIVNFAGVGVYIDKGNYDDNIAFNNGYVGFNGGSGFLLGSAGVSPFIETVSIKENLIEGNGGPGITIAGTNVFGFSFSGNTMQWDNVYTFSSNNEFQISGRLSGGFVAGNYFEVDTIFGSNSSKLVSTTAGAVGLQIANSMYEGGGMQSNGLPGPIYSAAGTALPAAATPNIGAKVLVSDAVTCVSGTTYASGGSTSCMVISNGTNWIETGTAYP